MPAVTAVARSNASTLFAREVTKPTNPQGLVLEAWAEGYMVGSLIILSCITVSNMRRKVLLHKLILLELVLGYWQGFFILFNPPVYAWWLSVAAIFLNASWSLHNIIAWMKLRPFLNKTWSRIFIGTVILVQPYWVVEIYANFTYFHNVNTVFLKTRPWEALCRDPWWIAAAVVLLYNIKTKYDLSATQIIRISPRFAVMLFAMLLSIAFIVLDVLSVTDALRSALPVGINPFWKLSFVFKCLTDAVVLDDFKTALDRLRVFKIGRLGTVAGNLSDYQFKEQADHASRRDTWCESPTDAGRAAPLSDLPRLPDGDGTGGAVAISQTVTHQNGDHHFVTLTRRASRDRDIEENHIDAVDYAADRQSSEAHMLGHEESRMTQVTPDSLDLDDDYAAVVRQITHELNSPRADGRTMHQRSRLPS